MNQMIDPPAANPNCKTEKQAVGYRRRDILPGNIWKTEDDLPANQAHSGGNEPAQYASPQPSLVHGLLSRLANRSR
jgi:hypothetical protein